ncbi:hypothetical protein [Natrinema halophilum]|uniref:Uncharacterized protein n=1 Tax=Natrinema halophilum TaxID=1699371 RepID=A0A7D5GJ67_9EURY|nr:hypothetical protein [Natrinema halophilum]QLG50488.1 hypothetical protein HYG82_17355 [Natrinema halophilum]
MTGLSKGSKEHLEKALENDDPSEKDFHIRQVIQAYGVDDLPDDIDTL